MKKLLKKMKSPAKAAKITKPLKTPKPRASKKSSRAAREWFALLPVLPQLLIIAVCLGLYFAMIKFYLFFQYGFYIYYALKVIIAYEVLSAARRSLILPLLSLAAGGYLLFTKCLYLTTLASKETGVQFLVLGLLGLLLTCYSKLRSEKRKL